VTIKWARAFGPAETAKGIVNWLMASMLLIITGRNVGEGQ
jgi:hypothetical protein